MSDDKQVSFSVAYERDARDSRVAWTWTILCDAQHPSAEHTYTGSDLETPTYDPVGALRALVSFLGAFLEAQRYDGSENRDLFPRELADNYDLESYVDLAASELEEAS